MVSSYNFYVTTVGFHRVTTRCSVIGLVPEAYLRLSRNVSKSKRDQLVERLLEDLHLEEIDPKIRQTNSNIQHPGFLDVCLIKVIVFIFIPDVFFFYIHKSKISNIQKILEKLELQFPEGNNKKRKTVPEFS